MGEIKRKRPYIFITTVPEEGILQFEGRVWENTAMAADVRDIASQVLDTPRTLTKKPSEETDKSNVEKQT